LGPLQAMDGPEQIMVTAIADEDLYLEGEYDRIVRVHKSEITEFKMKYTTPFSKMFEQYYLRHYLAPGSMAFFFTEKLRHDQCPAEVHMTNGDYIHIRNCIRPPKVPTETPQAELNVHLKELLANPILSDVTFKVEDESIRAHRAILAARCEKFRAMFLGNMREATAAEIKIEGHSALAFKALLEYIYTDRVENLNAQTALGLLSLSDEYLLASLTTICERTIAEQVTIENVGSVLSTADRFHAATLKKFCMDFILSNFNAVLNCSDFQESVKVGHPDLMFEILRSVSPYLSNQN
jgi:hypothetical protein